MIIYYFSIYLAGTLLLLYFKKEADIFLSKYSSIDSEAALNSFKKLARRNMKVTLPFGVFMIYGIGLGLNILSKNPQVGLIVFITANIPFFWAVALLRRSEVRTRELPCYDTKLIEEYNRVSRSWLQDFWPKF